MLNVLSVFRTAKDAVSPFYGSEMSDLLASFEKQLPMTGGQSGVTVEFPFPDGMPPTVLVRLLADVPPHCGIVTVLDGHPATLAWLGAVAGNRVRPLGVEHFGQTGSLADLYRHYGIDANAIVAAAQAIAPGRPIRHLKALP